MERERQQVLLVPQSAQDIVHIALRFSGPLDIPALRAALGVLVGSHALSRTRFALIDDMLVPAILRDDEFSLPLCDLWDPETPNADAAIDEILSKEARDSFDLDAGPLFRCRLLRIGLEDHVLSLVWHRIIADPVSAGRLCEELPAIYEAVRTNRSIPAVRHDLDFGLRWGLAAPPMPEEHGTYWLERLVGLPDLTLTADLPRSPEPPTARGHHRFALPAGRTGWDSATTVLAAFAALLARYADQDDIVVGVRIAQPARVVPLRLDLSGDPLFTAIIDQVRAGLPTAISELDLVQPAKAAGHPLFQVLFDGRRRCGAGEWNAGLRAAVIRSVATPVELHLELVLEAATKGVIQYRTDLFPHATIVRLAQQLTSLLDVLAVGMCPRLSELVITDPAESSDNPGPTFQGPFEGVCLSGCHSAFGDDLNWLVHNR